MTGPFADLTDMQLLAAVAKHGSVSAAADSVGISQPAASRRLHAIQSRVGVRLFQFGPRGATLTEAGRFWESEVRMLLQGLEEAQARFATAFHLRRGLYFAASHVIADHLVPRWLAGWQRPDSSPVSIAVGNSPQVLDMVASAKVDFGILEMRDAPPADLSSMRLFADTLVLVVAPGHAWARLSRRLTLRELGQTSLIHREATSGSQVTWMAHLAEAGAGIAPAALEADSLSAVKMAATSGVAPAILPRISVEEELRAGRLCEVAVEGFEPQVWVHAIWLPATELNPVARSFLEYLRRAGTLSQPV
ncbi:MAG: LysR family transcriptional regulator [Candidatus Limnocylindria bacterium]